MGHDSDDVSDDLKAVRKEFGDDVKEEVFVRRLEKRLEAMEKSDRPYLRKLIGFAIIGAAFYYGWTSLDRKSAEIVRLHKKQAQHQVVQPPLQEPAKRDEKAVPPAASDQHPIASLDEATLDIIGDCTKGTNAFRLLDLDKKKIVTGENTLESVFHPVFEGSKARRKTQLQNIRIQAGKGEEWRLHASPQGSKGELTMKLFRVAGDGLPEEIPFPDDLKDLDGAQLTDAAATRFLQHASTPGQAIEVERHESWSFGERTGLQIIWSNNHIFDIQAFMRDKFLACNRGERAGEPLVSCKCINR